MLCCQLGLLHLSDIGQRGSTKARPRSAHRTAEGAPPGAVLALGADICNGFDFHLHAKIDERLDLDRRRLGFVVPDVRWRIGLMLARSWGVRSLGFDVCGPDHLGPFLGFVGDEFAEVAGRSWKYGAAQVGKSFP